MCRWCTYRYTNGTFTRDRGGAGAEGEVAEVQAVAVGVLAKGREVELAEERKLAPAQRGIAEVDDRGRGGLVVRAAREQVDDARGRARGGSLPPRPRRERHALRELPR